MTTATVPTVPPEVQPTITPRNIDFALNEAHAMDWLDESPEKTLYLNALSILFPPGERFFIASVLANRDKVTDPRLKADVKAFCQQEAYHTREHVAYNKALNTFVDADKLERELTEYLDWVKKTLPDGGPLLATCALEHFTAIMAHALLEDRNYVKGALPDYERMWTWHALEECEHKAVAYDVFRATMRGPLREYRRMLVMWLTTITFVQYIGKHVIALMRAQGLAKSPVSWAKLLWYVFGYPGIMRRIAIPYLRYYNPKFHPNDIDDSAALKRTRQLVAAWQSA
jgi:predicted metal-dependent hydrolase